MPGFLGGGSAGSGGASEVAPLKEFIDPVTKIRVSNPANLIDTDFEYGLQPTKWETVELINNTPSFFSKSGDTTIPNITKISTIQGSREVTVSTSLEHGLSVGIPINVQGTKSLTADGSYIIASVPDEFTFTYLARIDQAATVNINDLYTAIITGEFFTGSQIRISDGRGIEVDTPVGASASNLTIKTESPHGFLANTPFYLLNLNSTISQSFDASNTVAKSFDSSNSATAQTFDGSNSATQATYNFSNNAFTGGAVPSSVTGSSIQPTNTITVSHGVDNFAGLPVGTPLYHDVTSATGYFSANNRGIVYIKDNSNLGEGTSTFTVSATPDGPVIAIEAAIQSGGTFVVADLARTFAGNNVNAATQVEFNIVENAPSTVDGANEDGDAVTLVSTSGGLVSGSTVSGEADLTWSQHTMVLYQTDGTAASGLTDNTTYWIDTIFQQGSTSTYSFTLKATPDGSAISSISGGTGTQTFTRIGVSLDKDYFSIENHGFSVGDMLRYEYPVDGRMTFTGGDSGTADYFYVESVPNPFTFNLSREKGGVIINDGSTPAKATSPAQLAADNEQYLLGLSSGEYWIDYQGTPTQMYVDMDGSQAGSSVGGWALIDTNFVHSNRTGVMSQVTRHYTYDGSTNTGRYNASRDDDELRVFSWRMPNDQMRGIRLETVYYNDVSGAESGAKYRNAGNLYNAAWSGSRINVGRNRGYAAWVCIPQTNNGNFYEPHTGGFARDAALVASQYNNLTDDTGFDYSRLMWYHADGSSEEILIQNYRIWVR